MPAFDIDEKSRVILECTTSNLTITTSGITEITGIPRATVQRRLKAMIDAEILRRDSSTRVGAWVITGI